MIVPPCSFICSPRHVQIMTLSLTETLFRDSIFKVSLRGTKCRSNPVVRDCFASLAMTLIRTAMLINMLRVGIIGVRGYTGEELISILLKHPRVKISYLSARVDKPVPISRIFPRFKNKINALCQNFNLEQALKSCYLFFLALPHTASMAVAPLLLKENKKVIDLSADYRIRDYKIYESRYKVKHTDIHNIKQAIYGLPELNKARIRKARFIANPGCFPTAAILAMAP